MRKSSTRRKFASARLAGALALALALVLTASCSRNKDPYADWKAPQMLEEGDRLLRGSDLAGAETAYRRGLDKAEKSGYSPDKTRIFLERLAYVAAGRENVAEAQMLMARTGGDATPETMDLRLATDLVLLLARAGRTDEARARAEKLARRFAARPPEPQDLPFYAIGWIAIDRLRTQNVELGRAREATGAFVETLKTWAALGQPLGAGPRAWIARYVDHLFDNDRSLVAQEIGDLVERIDERTPPPDDKSPCVPLDPAFMSLGCLPDWPK